MQLVEVDVDVQRDVAVFFDALELFAIWASLSDRQEPPSQNMTSFLLIFNVLILWD